MDNSGNVLTIISVLISLAATAVVVVGMWKLFVKAGKPGWGALIPLYNTYCMFDMAFGNGWLFLLTFVPCVNAVFLIIGCFKMAKAFGKGTGFGFGLMFLAPIFFLILAFGDAQYVGA